MSVAQAAVRRCHRVVLSAAFGALTFGVAAASIDVTGSSFNVTAAQSVSAAALATGQFALQRAATDQFHAAPHVKPTPKPAEILTASLPRPALAHNEMTCLAEAVYYEARGESIEGQRAVAEVVLRRTQDHRFPNTVCGVVYQGAHKRNACQFSFACDGITRGRRDRKAWLRAVEVAEYETKGEGSAVDSTAGAQYFHTVKVNPAWSRRFIRTARIGSHIFYRQPGGSFEASNGAVPAS